MPAAGQDEMRPATRVIRIVAIFLLIGPPAGGVTVWVATLAVGLWRGVLSPSDLRALTAIILFSYPFGGPFALACGIAHAVTAVWLRWNSIWVPLIAGSVLSAVDMLVWMYPYYALPKLEDVIVLNVAPMLAASLFCWRLTRGLARGV
jgi:hypothetical protein